MNQPARDLGIADEHIQPAPGLAVPEGEAFTVLSARIMDFRTPPKVRAQLMAAGAPHVRGEPKQIASFASMLAGALRGTGEPELAAHFTAEAWRLDPKNGGCRARARKTRSRPI